jgi:hypothetical protein
MKERKKKGNKIMVEVKSDVSSWNMELEFWSNGFEKLYRKAQCT